MKISLNWLQDFIDINITTDELVDLSSKRSTEIKSVVFQKDKYKDIVIGEILEISKHPNADKLQVAKVNTGSSKLNIVCGAPNIGVGQKVAVALVGSIVPSTWQTKSEFKLEKVKIRGVESEGMMCSIKELDIGDDHDGIYILPEDSEIGKPFYEVEGLDDIILDADFLTNQGYTMSHFGYAKEIGALTDTLVKPIHSEISLPVADENDREINVEIKSENCIRYSSIVLDNVKIQESPKWIQQRLRAVGLKPINNVVDVTNYVMYEIGQPLHAFDHDKVAKTNETPHIIVRESLEGEKISTLDGKMHELKSGVLLITDPEKPIALAGIMGGENTEIDTKTSKVIIESANFDAITIRQGARMLSIRTDAVARFEKVIDPNMTMLALKRVVELMLEISDATVGSAAVDVYPKELKPWTIMLDYEKVNKVIGIEIPQLKQMEILSKLGFKVDAQDSIMAVQVPTSRRDVKRDIDLIEEIIRVYGYDQIPLEYPMVPQMAVVPNEKFNLKTRIEEDIVGMGFYETQTYSFTGDVVLEKTNIDLGGHIKIINPQSPEREYMRRSLLPELLEAGELNLRRLDEVRLFEIQKTYNKNETFDIDDKNDVYAHEPEKLAAVWSKEGLDYYDIKGVVDSLAKSLKLPRLDFKPNDDLEISSYTFHPSRSAIVFINENRVGIIGEVHPGVLEKLDIEISTVAMELDLATILQQVPDLSLFDTYSKYQLVYQDLSLLLNESVLSQELVEAVEGLDSLIIKEVEIVDQYTGEGIPDGKKSLSLRLSIQSDEKTLTQEEMEEERNKVVDALKTKFKAELRN